MRPDKQSVDYLPGLDGWRALAVCAVILDHAQPFGSPRMQRHLQTHGEQAVWIFFAISGLLICWRLLEEEDRCGRISMLNFYLRRSFRILPPMLAYVLIVLALGMRNILPFSSGAWLAAVLFYRNYWAYFHPFASASSWFTGHFWSLSVEEHFYLLLPGILVWFSRLRVAILTGLTLLSLLSLALFLSAQPSPPPNFFWSQRTEFCLCALLLGALSAIAVRQTRARAWTTRWLQPTPLCLLLLVALWLDSPYVGNLRAGAQLIFLRAVFNPLVLLATVLHPGALVTRFLESAPLRFLGRISYSLYLWQTLFLTRNLVFAQPIHVLQSPVVGMLCTFACAIASYYLVETPAIRLGRKLIRSRGNVKPLLPGTI